jgi:hypothetical protein
LSVGGVVENDVDAALFDDSEYCFVRSEINT